MFIDYCSDWTVNWPSQQRGSAQPINCTGAGVWRGMLGWPCSRAASHVISHLYQGTVIIFYCCGCDCSVAVTFCNSAVEWGWSCSCGMPGRRRDMTGLPSSFLPKS